MFKHRVWLCVLGVALAGMFGAPGGASAQSTPVTPGYKEKMKAEQERRKAEEAKKAAEAKEKEKARKASGEGTSTTLSESNSSGTSDDGTSITVHAEVKLVDGHILRYLWKVNDGKCDMWYGFDLDLSHPEKGMKPFSITPIK
jgi:hypothetical protein